MCISTWKWQKITCWGSNINDDLPMSRQHITPSLLSYPIKHDDVVKREHFPHHWPVVRGIHLSSVDSPQKGQWRVALMFSLICAWTNCWANNRDAGDLRRHRVHHDITVINRLNMHYNGLNGIDGCKLQKAAAIKDMSCMNDRDSERNRVNSVKYMFMLPTM